MIFFDRKSAATLLAKALIGYNGIKNGIVIGLPRGGIVTADVIAKALKLSLDVICPRKIRAPFNPEYALGAVTENDVGYLNREVIAELLVTNEYLENEIKNRQSEALLRLKTYRQNKPPIDLKNKTVILVDDGLATGSTMLAAISDVRNKEPRKIIVAIPVAHPDSLKLVEDKADLVVCLYQPSEFYAVGQFYEKFDQTEDSEVIQILKNYL